MGHAPWGPKRDQVATGWVLVDRCPEGLARIYSDTVIAAERTALYGFADGRPWGEQEAWFLTACDIVREIPPFKDREIPSRD